MENKKVLPVIANHYLCEAIPLNEIAAPTEKHRARNDTVGRWTLDTGDVILGWTHISRLL